jgi:hypothetical protein
MESMAVAICSAFFEVVPRSSRAAASVATPFVFWILSALGTDDQTEADRRLLVVRNGNHLHTVWQRPDAVGRKLDLLRGSGLGGRSEASP